MYDFKDFDCETWLPARAWVVLRETQKIGISKTSPDTELADSNSVVDGGDKTNQLSKRLVCSEFPSAHRTFLGLQETVSV